MRDLGSALGPGGLGAGAVMGRHAGHGGGGPWYSWSSWYRWGGGGVGPVGWGARLRTQSLTDLLHVSNVDPDQ